MIINTLLAANCMCIWVSTFLILITGRSKRELCESAKTKLLQTMTSWITS